MRLMLLDGAFCVRIECARNLAPLPGFVVYEYLGASNQAVQNGVQKYGATVRRHLLVDMNTNETLNPSSAWRSPAAVCGNHGKYHLHRLQNQPVEKFDEHEAGRATRPGEAAVGGGLTLLPSNLYDNLNIVVVICVLYVGKGSAASKSKSGSLVTLLHIY